MEVIISGVSIEKVNDNASGTCNYDCGTYQ